LCSERHERKGWSQAPLTQATYDTKIQEINRLMDKLSRPLRKYISGRREITSV